MQDELVLASCCDRAYLPHLATAMRSAALSGTAIERWYLFGDASVGEEDRRTMLAFAADCGIDARWRVIPSDLLVGLPAQRPSTPIVWLRPFLPELLPNETRLLSLDADTLVLHRLEPLWRVTLRTDTFFAAVTQPRYRLPNPMVERLSMPSDAPYFNAGVMLMDLARMREASFSDRTRDYVRRNDRPRLLYNEQDALNVVFAGGWTPLDPVWNALTAVLMPFVEGATWAEDRWHDAWILERAARSPAIVHFEGAAMLKPWRLRCFNPFASLYRELRATTPWPLGGLEGNQRDAWIARAPLRVQFGVWILELKLATVRHRLLRLRGIPVPGH